MNKIRSILVLLILGGLADAAGLQIAGWWGLASMLAFSGAALLAIVGANAFAARAFAAWGFCVALAVFTPVVGTAFRSPAGIAFLAMTALIAITWVAAKLASVGLPIASQHLPARQPKLRRRANVVDGDLRPVDLEIPQGGGHDDLDLLGRRGR